MWLVHILATYLAAWCFLSVGPGAGVVGAQLTYLLLTLPQGDFFPLAQVQVWLVHILAAYLAARCFLSIGAGAGVVGGSAGTDMTLACPLALQIVVLFIWSEKKIFVDPNLVIQPCCISDKT